MVSGSGCQDRSASVAFHISELPIGIFPLMIILYDIRFGRLAEGMKNLIDNCDILVCRLLLNSSNLKSSPILTVTYSSLRDYGEAPLVYSTNLKSRSRTYLSLK